MSPAWDDLIRRHELTFGEAVRIRDEVGAGRAFAEPHVRAAAVDWARHLLETEKVTHLWATRAGRALLLVSLALVVIDVVRRLEAGRSIGWMWLGFLVLNLLPAWNRRRLLRETIRRNEGALAVDDDDRRGEGVP